MNQKFKTQITLVVVCLSLISSLNFSFASGKNSSPEFLFRQKIFYKVMELADVELQNLKESLDKVKAENIENGSQIKDRFLAKLSEFVVYHKEIKEKISQATEAQDLKNLALDFKNWREKTYNPQTQIIINFVLIAKQKEILITATERFEKIAKDVKKLTNLLGQEKARELNSLLDLAKNRIDLANNSYQKAKAMLDDYLSSALIEKHLEITTSTGIAEITTSTDSTENTNLIENTHLNQSIAVETQFNHFEFQELVKDSFEKIKMVYEIFLEMSKLALSLSKDKQ